MTDKELKKLVSKIRSFKAEFQTVEVKRAESSAPDKLYDTLSSFSNQSDGGIVVFGLYENNGFEITGVSDVQTLQKKVMEQCNQMEPPVRAVFTAVEIDGKNVVAAEIPPVDIAERPCFNRAKGRVKGSYVRVGDADIPMTEYEVYSYEAYRKKYQDDVRVVERAELSSLNEAKLNGYLLHLKENKPNLAALEDKQIMELMSVVRNGKPTVSAELILGLYPQAFFPQLGIIATAIQGTELGASAEDGSRFTDNKRIEGTIPEMLEGAMSFVRANTRVRTVIGKDGRRIDIPDYPMSAVREVILNALVHRDYSIHTEGMPVQLTIFSDRLEVKNPGGLYGRLTIDMLGNAQPDTRNPVLATALEVMGVT
ncbi:MAG: putative DNA binding domain-containing protein, partial [Oscillospiraceae bacterium]|nr:putative DNA binding domain-containing protein [Oscillospiraceae bacterium]